MIDQLQQKYDVAAEEMIEVEKQLSSEEVIADHQKIQEVSKKYSELQKFISAFKELENLEKSIKESEEILEFAQEDELKEMAKEELESLLNEKKEFEKKMLAKEDGESGVKSIIIEIRAGAGGGEAAIFAADLFRMYSRYAKLRDWKEIFIDSNPTSLGGYREIVFEVKGKDAYKSLYFESGVHRVQRIPETEKSGRVHTSTASVAVLPQVEAKAIEIRPQDLKTDYFHSGGPGGQNVNKVETAVRITHIPTGFVVASQAERSQLKNKEKALGILRSRIFQIQKEKEEQELGALRKEQVGTADRSEKIRTYNFPQDRITDHRINTSWHNIEKIMDGEMDDIVKDLQEKMGR